MFTGKATAGGGRSGGAQPVSSPLSRPSSPPSRLPAETHRPRSLPGPGRAAPPRRQPLLKPPAASPPAAGSPRPHSPLVVGFHPDLVGAVPAEAAPSAARSRHGAVAAAVPLRRHPPLPRGGRHRRARGAGGGGGGRAAAAATSSAPRCRLSRAPRPRPLLTAPARGGRDHGGGWEGEEGSTGKGRGRAWSRAGEEHGRFPAGRRSRSGSGRSTALPPGEGGRHASRVCVCPPRGTWALPRGTPTHTCGAERSTPRRKGGGGRDAGSKATTPMAPLLPSPRSPRHLVRPAARHAGTAGRQRGPGAGVVGGRRGRGAGAVAARPLSVAARSARLHPSWSRARERGEEGTPSFHFGTNRTVLLRPTGPQAPAAGVCGERWKCSPVSGGLLGRTKPIAAI